MYFRQFGANRTTEIKLPHLTHIGDVRKTTQNKRQGRK